MKWYFFGEDNGKPRINEHLMIYIISLLDPTSQFKASLVNHKWKEVAELTQKYLSLLPAIQSIPMFSKVGLDVLRLKLMSGGMTNTTIRVQAGPDISKFYEQLPNRNPLNRGQYKSNRWVLRIPGEISSFSVSRMIEAENARKVCELGLNVPIEYIDSKGFQLTQFIDNVQVLDEKILERVDILKTLASLAKKLHTSERFSNDIAVFDRNEQLLNALKMKKFVLPGETSFIEEQMTYLKKLSSFYIIDLSPCHNDSTPLNYMLASTGVEKNQIIYQIDWEYSGNNDFMWDLVYFSIEAKFTKEQELHYLNAYFGTVKPSVLAWFNAYKPVVEWWITLWAWTQLANEAKSVAEEAYQNLAMERYQKTRELLQSEDFRDSLSIIETDRLSASFTGQRPF
ncbi:choline kinase [Legionella wadsworthii]|uniref:Choline kinase n=1 Tax=Legionella wadsworthii TaxID=28088 RepID=A0A378LRV2_9GAMM|nr:choline/ethanolamine kinase family protein [Legionella wadsworthii]STY29437.1 choline kinase [Legionella wadsworthii]